MNGLPALCVLAAVATGGVRSLLEYPALVDLLLRGGPVMVPILLLSVLGLFFWLRGLLAVRCVRRQLPRGDVLLKLVEGDAFGALHDAARAGRSVADRIAERLLSFREDPASELRREALEVLGASLHVALASIRWVTTCAQLAPLFGLLGTVVGISITFSHVAGGGGSGDYARLAGGIHQALDTTIFGLCVSLLLTILGTILSHRVVSVEHAAGRFTDSLIIRIKGGGKPHGS